MGQVLGMLYPSDRGLGVCVRKPAMQRPSGLLQDMPGAGLRGTQGKVPRLRVDILRCSQHKVRDMQKAGLLKPQRSVQHLQQKSMQRMFAKEGADQEQDHL
jgi:hypothetical protein